MPTSPTTEDNVVWHMIARGELDAPRARLYARQLRSLSSAGLVRREPGGAYTALDEHGDAVIAVLVPRAWVELLGALGDSPEAAARDLIGRRISSYSGVRRTAK